jgi:hypothetical protein
VTSAAWTAPTEFAADGSPPELYAHYITAATRLRWAILASTDVRADDVELCAEDECTIYDRFVVDASGKLVTFSTDGSPINERLRADDAAAVSEHGVSARLVAAYATARGDLFVALENGGEGVAQVDDCGATYVGPDRRQVNQSCVSRQPRVRPGATASVLYKIDQAPLGGVLSITAATDEREAGTFHDSAALDVPVPA